MDNRLKPTRERPGHSLQRLLGTLARAFDQLHDRLASRFFIFALEPSSQLLHPIDHLPQLWKTPTPVGTCNQLVYMELIRRLQPAGRSFFSALASSGSSCLYTDRNTSSSAS